MSDAEDLGLIGVDLRAVFCQPGCPVCRLKEETAQRYMYFLLWENVNDSREQARDTP